MFVGIMPNLRRMKMSRIFATWRDPYNEGFSTCRKRKIEILPGITVLVGCNGAGKSTLLHNIESELKKDKIPYFQHNNESNGKSNLISEAALNDDFGLVATSMCSSEGENISYRLGLIASRLKKFIETGDCKDRWDRLADTMKKLVDDDYEEKENEIPNERWILLDAMDSGFSIDNVIEMKDLFELVYNHAKSIGIEVYIVISANEFELARNMRCFDVMTGKYVWFGEDYEKFREFIIKSREKKDKRYK